MRTRYIGEAGLTRVVVCALMLGVAPHGWAGDQDHHGQVHEVLIPEEDRFTPYALTIHPGDSVQWVNQDTDDHTVVSDDAFTTAGHQGIDHLLPGTDNNHGQVSTFTRQFSHPGVFVYYCRCHAHLDADRQPVAPGPDGGIQDANGNFGTPMTGVITVLSCGGVFNYNGTVTLEDSRITGNTADFGGGISNRGGDTTLTLVRSTITGNTAIGRGSGVFLGYNCYLTLIGSLVAGNMAPSAPEIEGSKVWANASNLFGFNGDAGVTGFTPGPTDLIPSVPLAAILDPVLADHGGPTLTHALVPGSPAIDAIPWGTNGCGTTLISDQRDKARPQPAGGNCDIGAYEVAVAGQPLGAWVTGLTPETVVCQNVTTGHAVTLSDHAPAWDCEAAGLGVSSGDHVSILASGTVEQGATDVGGAVAGMTPSSAGCTNLTTGQSVPFQHLVGATAASCVAAGVVIHPGDSVQMSVQGIAE
jgi:plastocyanin